MTWSHFDSYEWISTRLVWEYATCTDYVLTVYCLQYVRCTGCCTVFIWCRRCDVTCYCGMCRKQCMGVIPCQSGTRAHNTHPRNSIIDHWFSLCVAQSAWVSYQQNVTRVQNTHPRIRSSTIDSRYVSDAVHGCHTSRAEPGLANTHPRNRSLDHRFYLCVTVSQCMSVILCHTSRVEPGLAPLTWGIGRQPSILSTCCCVTVHGCYTSRSRVEPRLCKHSPGESILDHPFSLCVNVSQCMGVIPAEWNQGLQTLTWGIDPWPSILSVC